MEILTGIAAAKEALEIAKALKGIEKSYDEAALKARLAELISALADAKMALVDAKEELAKREEEINSLKAAFEQRTKLLVADGGYKYFTSTGGNLTGFPICPSCELDGKIVQLKQSGASVVALCPKCKSDFNPVTCFVDGADGTLQARDKRLKSEASARSYAALERINSGIY